MNPMHTSEEDTSSLVQSGSAASHRGKGQLGKSKDKGDADDKGQNPLLVSLVGKDRDGAAGDVSTGGSDAKVVGKDTDGGVFGSYTAQTLVFFAILSAAIGAALPSAGFFVFVSKFGMSLVWSTNVGIITFIISLPLKVLFAALGDNLHGDRWYARWGRRKPFIAAAIPFYVVGALMFAFPARSSTNPSVLELWYLLACIATTIASALYSTPFSSWLIESCASATEYKSIAAIATFAGLLGALGAQILITLGLISIPVVITLFLLPICTALILWLVPSRVLSAAPAQPPIVSSFRECIRTKEFRTVFTNSTLLAIAQGGAGEFIAVMMYSAFGMGTLAEVYTYFSPIIIFIAVGGVATIALTLCVLAKPNREKLMVYRAVMLLFIVLGVLWFLSLVPSLINVSAGDYSNLNSTPRIPAKTMKTWMVIFLIIFACNGIVCISAGFIQGLFVRDLIIFDTFANRGVKRENVYQVAISQPSTLLSAVITNTFLGIVYSSGFAVKGSDSPLLRDMYAWNRGTIIQGAVYILFFSTIIGYMAYWIMSDYPLTSKVADQLEKVNLRREAEAVELLKSKGKGGEDGQEQEQGTARMQNAAATAAAKTNGSTSTSSSSSRASATPFDVSSPWTPTQEQNTMMHLSALENKAISESPTQGGRNVALFDIRKSIIFSGFILGPLTLGALLWAVLHQIQDGGDFATLLLNFFLAVGIYVAYETYRYLAVSSLCALPPPAVQEIAKRQVEHNEKYTMGLQQLLEQNAIDEDERADAAGDSKASDDDDKSIFSEGSLVHRLTFVEPSQRKRLSVAVQPEQPGQTASSGYKRIYALLSALLMLAVAAALQPARKN